MLMEQDTVTEVPAPSGTPATDESSSPMKINQADQSTQQLSRLSRVLRIEWLGQTVASLCWITSVFFYGLSSIGDWLQLAAASAWFIANIAAVISVQAD